MMDKLQRALHKVQLPEVFTYNSLLEGLDNRVETTTDKWKVNYFGQNVNIDWTNIQRSMPNNMVQLFKLFLIQRFQSRSLATVIYRDWNLLRKLSTMSYELVNEILIGHSWEKFLNELVLHKQGQLVFSFKSLIDLIIALDSSTISVQIHQKIKAYNPPNRNAYDSIFLNQNMAIDVDSESKLFNFFEEELEDVQLQRQVLLNICYELAPRPAQLYYLNTEDLTNFGTSSGNSYYGLNLPMAKKVGATTLEKRMRRVSQGLGRRIEKLISTNHSNNQGDTSPLFKDKKDRRLSGAFLSTEISKTCFDIGLKHKVSATEFRHHLAQGLADQGASAEIIAEILGHNSLVPARAYIAATPKIAEIKTRALGKNNTFLELSEMMTTGKIKNSNQIKSIQHVKGLVGTKFIGGIGGCGLDHKTHCPKNPVYACYTCKKFHPFRNGNHKEVLDALQEQAQFFLDISEQSLDISHSRVPLQLEKTIESVSTTIELLKSNN